VVHVVPSRMLAAVLILCLTPLLHGADGAVGSRPAQPVSYILIGFAGGFVRHDNPHHGPVQLAQRIRPDLPKDAFVRIFENRRRKDALRTILHLLDSDHNGALSLQEKSHARIILFGHSWGASAVVLLARELNREGVPVLLTVQVDSVAKFWQHDGLIPGNVTDAANFYQPHGFIHGRSLIRAAHDSKTQILGNYRHDYRDKPVQCAGTSWFDRTFTPSHMQSQCDPRLWSEVESLVLQRIQPQTGAVLPLQTP